jgi:hypothetical protein
MKRFAFAISLLAILALAACGTQGVKPQTARQTYAIASGDFDAAQAIVLKYEALPPCGGAAKLCRNEATVAKAKTAVLNASAALDMARKTIDDPSFGTGAAQTAMVIAQNALALLTAITASLPIK